MRHYIFLLVSICAFLSCDKEEYFTVVPKACFGTQINQNNDAIVQFTNCSENAKSYFWDFGDGTTSIKKEPVHVFEGSSQFIITLIVSNQNYTDTLVKPLYNNNIIVYKPNIYIYPETDINLCLSVSFPLGGSVITSIPDYNKGWCVDVNTSGIINNQYNYLFYESTQPNIFQYNKGWCIRKEDLKQFFEQNMGSYNFSIPEIKDFADYWIPLLTENNFYKIYPQTNFIIDKIIRLDFSIQPDNVSRLFYGIVGTDKMEHMENPEIVPFNRQGFSVVEWGVFRD